MMRAGKLDRIITIQRPAPVQGPDGEIVQGWTTIAAHRAASVRPAGGSERWSNPSVVAEGQVEFQVRWSPELADLNPRDRVVYPALPAASPSSAPEPTTVYDILGVAEIGRREGLQIIAKRRPDIAP